VARGGLLPLAELRRIPPFERWEDAPEPWLRSLRRGWPSLESLDRIIELGRERYAIEEGARLAAALGTVLGLPARERRQAEDTCREIARQKWVYYEAFRAEVRALPEKAGTQAWVDRVQVAGVRAMDDVANLRHRRKETLVVVLVDYIQGDGAMALLESVARHDE
jgi:hypothetical protein